MGEEGESKLTSSSSFYARDEVSWDRFQLIWWLSESNLQQQQWSSSIRFRNSLRERVRRFPVAVVVDFEYLRSEKRERR